MTLMATQLAHSDPEIRTAELAALTGPGPFRRAFRRIFLAIREINHASRRLVEVQAPWTVDAQWHSR
jgi:hypothetical protein